jgi:hypothetical protein
MGMDVAIRKKAYKMNCAADLRNLLEEGSLAERKAFVRSFVQEVKTTRDNVSLTYTLPMLPKGLNQETESVLDIVHRGGAGVSIGRTYRDFELSFSLID